MKKTHITMKKAVYVRLSILEPRKTAMYEFWYDYLKPKYGKKAKLCYMDTDSFITHVKTEGIYKDIAEHVGTRFDTSYYEIDRPLSVRKNKKLVGLMKDELGGEKSWKKMLDRKQIQIAI